MCEALSKWMNFSPKENLHIILPTEKKIILFPHWDQAEGIKEILRQLCL